MSIRLKILLGVALIEGVILLFLVWSSIEFLTSSNQDELTKRAITTSRLFAAMVKNPILSTDLATLESVVGEMLSSPGVIYVRVKDTQQVLAEGGDQAVLNRHFIRDERFDLSSDGVFDIDALIEEGGSVFGRVELGLSVNTLNQFVTSARNRLLTIALVEMILVAVFSFFLGSYLTRGLNRLTEASQAISCGELGTQVQIKDGSELSVTAKAFNTMSTELLNACESMTESLTESQRLAKSLARSELRLQTILNTAIDGVVTVDQQGVISEINSACCRLFGYHRNELLGENIGLLIPELIRSPQEGLVQSEKSYNDEVAQEVHGFKKNKQEFPLELSIGEMNNDGEELFIGLIRDITGRKQMERAINRNENLKRAVIEASIDSIITVDQEGFIIEFSKVAQQVFGYKRDEAIGNSINELIMPSTEHEGKWKVIKKYFSRKRFTDLRPRFEVPAKRKNGEEFPTEITVTQINIDNNVYFTTFIRDITEQKANEKKLKQAKLVAESASRAKSRFLAHMSHEIRSPLNAVLGATRLLSDSQLNEQQFLYANTAETSGNALLGIINDVLDFSKIEAGQLTLESVKFNLKELIASVIEVVGYRLEEKQNLDLISVMDKHVCAQLLGDHGRLRQIMINMLDNAAKFTQEGSIIFRTNCIKTNDTHQWIRFEIEDSGIGIAEELRHKLFSEFSQVDNSDSTQYGGTGLGLAICRQLVELMGGRIGMQSSIERGSLFWFEIPIQLVSENLEPAIPEVFNTKVLLSGFSSITAQAIATQLQIVGCQVEQMSLDASTKGLDKYDSIIVNGDVPSFDCCHLNEICEPLEDTRLVVVTGNKSSPESLYDQLPVRSRIVYKPLHTDMLFFALRETSQSKQRSSPVKEKSPADLTFISQEHRVLLAEDSLANQFVATEMLKNEGFIVDVANNGVEAVELFKEHNYDIILMDMRMPKMDGLTATKTIRSLEPNKNKVPILAMSANAMQSDIQRCIDSGMNDYVAKPVNKENLLSAIKKLIVNHQKSHNL